MFRQHVPSTYSARDERVIERVSLSERLLEEEWSGEVRVKFMVAHCFEQSFNQKKLYTHKCMYVSLQMRVPDLSYIVQMRSNQRQIEY